MAFLLKVSLSTLAILTGLILVGQPVEAIKPMAPLEMTMELDGTPQVGGEVPVSLKIRSFIEVPLVKIQLTLPEGIAMVSGQDIWEGELTAGSLKEMTFILKVTESGRHVVRAMAMIQFQDGLKMAKEASLVIDLGTEQKQKSKPKRKGPIIRKDKDGQDIGEFPLD